MTKASYLAATAALTVAVNSFGAPVVDWHTFRANTATQTAGATLSGQGTDDPSMGSFTPNPAASSVATSVPSSGQNGVILGYLPSPITLANTGDSITFTFGVRFNDDLGMAASSQDNFRYALYDLNGEAKVTADETGGATTGTTDTDTFKGYWFGASTSGGNGSIRRRNGTTQVNPFANAGGDLLGTPTGTGITYDGAIDGVGGETYTGVMTLTRNGTALTLAGTFTDPSGPVNTFSFSDTAPSTFTFAAVGYLNGNGLTADQMILQDVTVTTNTPEPTTAALVGLSLLGATLRRRVRNV